MPTRVRVASRFRDIRLWDGSQDRAFEELCFQLRDPTPVDVELIKTSAPDAGLEWYWRRPDGAQLGWQVKFIFETGSLLDAMRASLKAAVAKRPQLTSLTFCIPYDLADDPSRSRGKQARERFEEAEAKWSTEWPHVAINLVTAGELLGRLAREEHRGREWFFFGERILGAEWCASELSAAIEDAGDRYTPSQDVELPIDSVLEAVALPSDFETQVFTRRDALLLAARDLIKKSSAQVRWGELLAKVEAPLARLEATNLIHRQPPTITTDPALKLLAEAGAALEELRDALRPVAWPDKLQPQDANSVTEAERAAIAQQEQEASSAQYVWTHVRKVEDALFEFNSFLKGPTCQAAERRALFVEGVAGTGKTHLFCDVGQRLVKEGHPVLVILGQRFRDASPWITLARTLGEPNLSPDEIATAFAASGEASGRRAAVIIDALNETKDPAMWAAELADVRRRLTATGWVGLAVSCRTTYLDLVEPVTGPDKAFVRIEHLGYRGREFEATARIFAAHGVQQPRVPLLLPEFSNPLFLKLYCEAAREASTPLAGSEHLSAIFERFVDGRKTRVERALALDPRLDVVGQAITAFAEHIAERGDDRVPYEDAHRIVNGFAPHLRDSPRTLIETMASDGLLSIERGWIREREELGEVVSFPYQRFSDHLVLNALLDKQLPTEATSDVLAALDPGGPLGIWLRDAPGGLIEALAIQLPERWGIELPDLYPTTDENDRKGWWRLSQAWDAFISSIVLRDRQAFGERTRDLINNALNTQPRETADALISVAPDPDHPYNGTRLHNFLSGIPMPDRDAYWTEMHYYALGDPSQALDRLIRWAARGPYPEYPAEVIELACVPLIWQLASPNRFSRDYTTKALATILIDRPDVCLGLVDSFGDVDDPYVVQRLAAAILGAVTRGTFPLDKTQAHEIVEALVATLIESDKRLPDILTRDYVASLARWLRRHGLISPRLLRRASPPYASRRPKVPRTRAHLERTYPASEKRHEGYASIRYSALSTHSDWARYVVSGRVDDFLPVKIGEPVPPEEPIAPPASRIDQRAWTKFVASLSDEQRSLDLESSDDVGQLLETLTDGQTDLLRKVSVTAPSRRKFVPPPLAVPPERAGRFIFQRCIELGWSPERFGEFDSNLSSRGRESRKPERFGKKYQWIALFELLARLTDNFVFKSWGTEKTYEGAWQLNLRDIDPTLPPERIEVREDEEYARSPTFPVVSHPAWWSPESPTFSESAPGQEGAWAELTDDLPAPDRILQVMDADDKAWVVVNGYHNWREDPDNLPTLTGESPPDRELAILTGAALIRQKDQPRLRKWLSEEHDLLRSLPDWHSQGIYGAFWSELPTESVAYDYPAAWRRPSSWANLPVSSAAVSIGYLGESGGSDCSLTDSVTVDLPSRFLAELGQLRWSEDVGAWVDESGEARACYHETDEGFHRDRILVLDKNHVARLLIENQLVLAIGLFSERRVFDRASRSVPRALGWSDYVGHVLFDGTNWESIPLHPYERHAGLVDEDEASSST